jgi:cob(I)alamin adenosyltransferase
VYIDAFTKLFFSEEDLVAHMKDIVPEEKVMKEKEIERLTAELKQAKDELEDLNRFLSYHKEG